MHGELLPELLAHKELARDAHIVHFEADCRSFGRVGGGQQLAVRFALQQVAHASEHLVEECEAHLRLPFAVRFRDCPHEVRGKAFDALQPGVLSAYSNQQLARPAQTALKY